MVLDTRTGAKDFAATAVARCSHWRYELRDEDGRGIEWPEAQSKPEKYALSSLPADPSLERLMVVTKMR